MFSAFSPRSGISSDVRTKIENKDSKVFQGMANREFRKLTPDMIAAAGVSIVIVKTFLGLAKIVEDVSVLKDAIV